MLYTRLAVLWNLLKYSINAVVVIMLLTTLFIFYGRLSIPGSSEPNRPIFTEISVFVDGCKGLFSSLSFFDFSRDVAMATNKVEKSSFFPDQSTLSLCHSETEWDNA